MPPREPLHGGQGGAGCGAGRRAGSCESGTFENIVLYPRSLWHRCFVNQQAKDVTSHQEHGDGLQHKNARQSERQTRRARAREHIAGRAHLGGRGRWPGRHTRPERAPSGSAGGKGPPVTRPALSRKILMTRTHFPADPTHREPAGHSVTDGRSADSLTRLAPTVGGQRLQPPASSQFSVKQENELPAL